MAHIDEREIAALSAKYGQPWREHHYLDVAAETLAYWKERTREHRGEVVFFLLRKSDKVLLHRKDFYPLGIYRVPSGGIRHGESILSALHREATEETGLLVTVQRFLALVTYDFLCQGDRLPFVSYLFVVASSEQAVSAQDKGERITEYREVPLADLTAIAEQLESLSGRWRDWGRFRAVAHRVAARHWPEEEREGSA
ncbi:MAG: NUDIX hydrolase [Chloroflexi bacterium]|nr:NUDIX hydrolase [Chloroflexota bacterium]